VQVLDSAPAGQLLGFTVHRSPFTVHCSLFAVGGAPAFKGPDSAQASCDSALARVNGTDGTFEQRLGNVETGAAGKL
jgi:hypothetical protein